MEGRKVAEKPVKGMYIGGHFNLRPPLIIGYHQGWTHINDALCMYVCMYVQYQVISLHPLHYSSNLTEIRWGC